MALTKPSTHQGDHHFEGDVSFGGSVALPADVVGGANFNAADPLPGNKSIARVRATYSQKNVAAVTETIVLYVAHSVATLIEVYVTNIARATGGATVTVDIKKNGVTMLTALITLDNAHPASGATFGVEVGTIVAGVGADLADGDVVTAVITATVGGGVLPTGVGISAMIDEEP